LYRRRAGGVPTKVADAKLVQKNLGSLSLEDQIIFRAAKFLATRCSFAVRQFSTTQFAINSIERQGTFRFISSMGRVACGARSDIGGRLCGSCLDARLCA